MATRRHDSEAAKVVTANNGGWSSVSLPQLSASSSKEPQPRWERCCSPQCQNMKAATHVEEPQCQYETCGAAHVQIPKEQTEHELHPKQIRRFESCPSHTGRRWAAISTTINLSHGYQHFSTQACNLLFNIPDNCFVAALTRRQDWMRTHAWMAAMI